MIEDETKKPHLSLEKQGLH